MKRWEGRLLHASLTLLAGSGALYGVMKYVMAPFEPDSPLGHPWQPDVMKIHILVAPFFVFGFGLIYRVHILERLKRGARRGRRSGFFILSAFAPLVLSGYLVQAMVSSGARNWSGWIHAGLGLVVSLVYLAHPRKRRLVEVPTIASGDRSFEEERLAS